LVGRERELESVRATAGGGVVIAGEAGVGKTRLAREIAEAAVAPVEWVRATRSAASMPLGAFAALLGAERGEGVELLARARHALAEKAEGRRLVLCVDDGQHLDDASAALVHQLVAAGEAFAVVTLRRGERAPDALQALWKDELCELIELEPLPRESLDGLLAAALGGPVDGRSLLALWELTQGNALFLRELVHYGTGRGLLAEDGGVWRWHGELGVGARLTELVGARLDGLSADERAALEVVAVGAPVEARAIDARALETLERLEIVEHRAERRRRVVDVAHPLHGEVVRAGLARTRLEAIQRELADAVEARGARRRGDLARLALWRLESGGGDDALFERAAEHALAARDNVAAERFARAAGEGFNARLTLGRALAGEGRAEEAEALLGALEPSSDEHRAAQAIAIARNRFWALDRAEEAFAVLNAAVLSSPGPRAEVLAQRARLAAASGRPHEALASAIPLLDDAEAPETAHLHAAVAASEAMLALGRCTDVIALTRRWEPVAARHTEIPLMEGLLRSQRGVALRLAGDLIEATALTEENYARALTVRSAMAAAVEAAALGYVWLSRGRPRTAERLLRECASLLRDADPVGMVTWALAGVAQAAAQAGDAAAAREALAEMERRPLGHKGFESELGLARAWTAASAGELSRATELAKETADADRERSQHAYELQALHVLTRLGEPDPEAVRRLSVDGPFAVAALAYAEARDGRALLEAANLLASQDRLLEAAEAAQRAAAALREEGRNATPATTKAAAWLASCEGARPPTLLDPATADLTPREREIALLAAQGRSSREIADRLVLSVRTVDNHLQSAYRKLGVSGRGELSAALG
jgi:DNA-binding CsgD family transcriptional regulator